jgi:hypothetical protein
MSEEVAKNIINQSGIASMPTPEEGQTLQRMQTKYTTAVSVQKPRDLDQVVAAVMREAEYAGESFFYSWGEGRNHVEGPSVGLALTVAREWTNCAVETDIEESKDSYIFNAHFVDIEKGFTISRPFRQSKKWTVFGKMDDMRKDDTRFQIGASKAIRNVVKSAVPNWLLVQAIAKAKETVYNGITKDGIAASSEKAISAMGTLGVDEDRIIAKVGKPKVQWNTQDIVTLRTAYAAIRDGEAYAEEIFPSEAQDSPMEKGKPADKPAAKPAEKKPINNTPKEEVKLEGEASESKVELTKGEKAAATRAKNKAIKEEEAKKLEEESAKEADKVIDPEVVEEGTTTETETPEMDSYTKFNLLIEEAKADPGMVVGALCNMKVPQLQEGQGLKDLTEPQLLNFIDKWAQFEPALQKYIAENQ